MSIKLVFVLLASLLLTVSCTEEREHDSLSAGQPGKGVTFRIGLSGVSEREWTRAGAQDKITRLWYVITDSRGNVINPAHQRLEDDFSSLTIERLSYGKYTIAFLATTAKEDDPSVWYLKTISDEWLFNSEARVPFGKDYFYKKVELVIDKSQQPIAMAVIMERCMARVDIVMNMTNPYHEHFIKDVRVEFDNNSTAYSSLNASGEYSLPKPMIGCNVDPHERSFISFPSVGKLAGTISVTSSRSDGSLFVRDYRFSGCELVAGKVTRIAFDYIHPESENGLIYVGEGGYTQFDTDTMFLAREPRSVFYDKGLRSFHVNKPVQLSISADRRLQVRFFSPISVRNVTVLCRFNNYSNELFEFAKFEELSPFQESSLPIPVVTSSQTYRSQSGRNVTFPAMPSLSTADVSFFVQSDDPFLEKIAQIKSAWYIRFSPYGADEGHQYWRHMTPELCRHGVALALNMSFMFSHPEFETELAKYDGILMDGAKKPINLEQLKKGIATHPGLLLGNVVGVGGLGGGEVYGLADYCYRGVYFDATPPDSNPHNYARMAMFHEYGHCLGYDHASNMTYGDVWTVLCAKVFVSMGKAGMLPVNSKDEIANLPM